MKTKIFHADVWGLRDIKYNWLKNHEIKTTKWQKLSPKSEFYFFIPRDEKLSGKYEKFIKITEIFPANSVGIVTSRDTFVIDANKRTLINRIQQFKNSSLSDDDLHEYFRINKKKGWNIRNAWNILQNYSDSDIENHIQKILYRPFDERWIFYHDSLIERSRKEVMRNMMHKNLGLITTRFVFKKKYGFHHAFVTLYILDINQIHSPGTAQLFPLYIYPPPDKKDLFSHIDSGEKKSNINKLVFKFIIKSYTKKPSPENIFYYIYAVLYSNFYRTRYAEFLKIDFPRVPFTKDYTLFQELGKFGERLAGLHLMKSKELDNPIAKYPVEGNHTVECVRYDSKNGSVYINRGQYFSGVSQDVWEYWIGGYQVCYKWLNDRKKRKLSLDDIRHYCRIVTAIEKTIEIQKKIDEIYPEVEK